MATMHFHAEQAHDPCSQSLAYMRGLLQQLDYNQQGFVQSSMEALQLLDTRVQRLCDRDFFTPATQSEFVAWSAARGYNDDYEVYSEHDNQKEVHHLLELIVFGMTVSDLAAEVHADSHFVIDNLKPDEQYRLEMSPEAKAITALLTLNSTALHVELKRTHHNSVNNSLYVLGMATATAANRWLKIFHQHATEAA